MGKPKLKSTIADLTPDPRNANRGTERGSAMLEASLRQFGAGRSLLVDKHGVVIAGNKTLEAAASIGIEKVRVVETDGTELVVVQRTDLDLAEDPRAKALGVADNRVAQVGLEWDTDVLRELAATSVDLRDLFTEQELVALVGAGPDDMQDTSADVDVSNVLPSKFMVLITCQSEQQQVALLDRFSAEGIECKALVS